MSPTAGGPWVVGLAGPLLAVAATSLLLWNDEPAYTSRRARRPQRTTSGSAARDCCSLTKGAVSGSSLDAPLTCELDEERQYSGGTISWPRTDGVNDCCVPTVPEGFAVGHWTARAPPSGRCSGASEPRRAAWATRRRGWPAASCANRRADPRHAAAPRLGDTPRSGHDTRLPVHRRRARQARLWDRRANSRAPGRSSGRPGLHPVRRRHRLLPGLRTPATCCARTRRHMVAHDSRHGRRDPHRGRDSRRRAPGRLERYSAIPSEPGLSLERAEPPDTRTRSEKSTPRQRRSPARSPAARCSLATSAVGGPPHVRSLPARHAPRG
jgi:hypothetical protein